MDKQFYHYLYSNDRVSEMVVSYCKPLLKDVDPLCRLRTRKLLDYWHILKDNVFLIGDENHEGLMIEILRQVTNAIENHFNDLDYHMTVRIKDLFSTLNKLDIVFDDTLEKIKFEYVEKTIKKLKFKNKAEADQYRESLYNSINAAKINFVKEEFNNFIMNYNFKINPFDKIRDFFAFRIVIEDEGVGDKIEELYEMANLIIELVNTGTAFDVLPAMPLTKTGSLKNKSPLITVPKKSGLTPSFLPLAKDYVMNPKADGYQSLHIVLHDPFTKQYVEIQLCTRSMRLIAETEASHEKHKERKYGRKQKEVAETIDFSKIHLANNHFRYYKYVDDFGKEQDYVYDTAGITKPFVFDLHNIDKLKKFLSTW